MKLESTRRPTADDGSRRLATTDADGTVQLQSNARPNRMKFLSMALRLVNGSTGRRANRLSAAAVSPVPSVTNAANVNVTGKRHKSIIAPARHNKTAEPNRLFQRLVSKQTNKLNYFPTYFIGLLILSIQWCFFFLFLCLKILFLVENMLRSSIPREVSGTKLDLVCTLVG